MGSRLNRLLESEILSSQVRPSKLCSMVMASLCCTASTNQLVPPSSNAIMFLGDRVQNSNDPIIDRLSNMETLANILVSKLGEFANVWIVAPPAYAGPFACYLGLCPQINAHGDPLGYDPHGVPAARASLRLLDDCLSKVQEESAQQKPAAFYMQPPDILADKVSPKTLLFGFSKGGVVLNQLLAEMVHVQESPIPATDDARLNRHSTIIPNSAQEFLESIQEIHYVDVGLNCPGAYHTDPSLLEGFAKVAGKLSKEITIVLHGTPRQWHDERRPWILQEKECCLKILQETAQRHGKGKLKVDERLYFADKQPSLQMHFEILEALVL